MNDEKYIKAIETLKTIGSNISNYPEKDHNKFILAFIGLVMDQLGETKDYLVPVDKTEVGLG